jgi:glycosyltransferase involved in cell wall biosynthesis
MTKPLISVIIPVRNEADRLPATIRSIANARSRDFPLEVILVDDASTDGCCSNLVYEGPKLAAPNLSIRVFRLDERVGVPRARNQGANIARGDILFMTDSHVRFSKGWNRYIENNIRDNRILAATIADTTSSFKGYGCSLIVPFMGTKWIKGPLTRMTPVQIAACSGTILKNNLFKKIGGYDPGMILYGAAEPEFSVRAWLSGAEILSLPQVEIFHRFKPQAERKQFVEELRPYMIHNSLRFGMLYLSELAILQMIRHFAMKFPNRIQKALRMVENSDVWQRRDFLSKHLRYDFHWFIKRFDLKDQVGQRIL